MNVCIWGGIWGPFGAPFLLCLFDLFELFFRAILGFNFGGGPAAGGEAAVPLTHEIKA